MKNKLNFTIVYFLTRSLFLGLIYSKMFNLANEDSILAGLFGTIIGIFIIIFLYKVDFKNKYNKVILFFLYTFLIYLGLMNIEYFINAFYLKNTPNIIIAIPIVLLCLYASFKHNNTIINVSKILFIISISTILINFIALSKNFNISNFLPIFNSKLISFFKASLLFAIASSLPNILIINKKSNYKKHIKYYTITCLINILINIAILLTLSSSVAKMYSFPEYMVLKNINFLNFIENIENILSIVFYFDIFILLTLTFKKIYALIKNKYLYFIFIIFVVTFSTFKIISYYYILLFIYNYLYLILIIFFILLHKKS